MMNSSAKILSTLVAAGALGAVAIACTVSSGTVDDVDGGSSSGQASSSSSSSSSGSTEAGASSSSSGAVDTCPAAKIDINDNDSADCKACLRNSCCSQITAYEDHGADVNGLYGTDNYAIQLSDCDDHDGADECKELSKKNPPTQDGIPAIYDAYLSCRTTSCATQCAGVAEADAGSK